MRNLKVWLALALVFLAGFAGGVVSTRAVTRRVVRAVVAHPELIQGRIERDLSRKLKLDERQKARLHEVLLMTRGQLKELRQDFQPRVRSILTETRRQISPILTPAQQGRFEEYLAEHPLPFSSTPAASDIDSGTNP